MTTLSQSTVITTDHYVPTARTAIRTTVAPRKLAIAAGVCFLITHVTAIGAPALYGLATSNAVSSAGTDMQLMIGALLEVVLALAIIGTSVALYPVARCWNEGAALGYVGLRTLEAGVIAVGVLPLLTLVTLQHSSADTLDAATVAMLSDTLVTFYKWTLLIGPGFVCAANTVVMAYIMFSSRLVPRFIPILGLIGGPLIFIFTIVRMFGGFDQRSPWAAIAVIPIFAWEVSLALWLISKGFRQAALRSLSATTADQ